MTQKKSLSTSHFSHHKEHPFVLKPLFSNVIISSLIALSSLFLSPAAHAGDPACGNAGHGWLPWTWAVYTGDSFTQKNHCGATRTMTGSKNHPFWINDPYYPKSNTVCKNTIFTQTLTKGSYSTTRPNWGTSLGGNWQPAQNTQCVGTTFTQTSSCNATRSRSGTKPVGGYTPATNTQTCGVTFTQTRVCGSSRSAVGTANTSDWTPAANTVCQGTSFTQTRSCGAPRTISGTKTDEVCAPPATPSNFSATNVMPYDAHIQWDDMPWSDEYRLEKWSTTSGVWAIEYVGPMTSYQLADLPVDDYEFKVTACSAIGCSASTAVAQVAVVQQYDTDGDGVYDYEDICSGTPSGASVNLSGCDLYQADSDGDGIHDFEDPYPHQGSNMCVGV